MPRTADEVEVFLQTGKQRSNKLGFHGDGSLAYFQGQQQEKSKARRVDSYGGAAVCVLSSIMRGAESLLKFTSCPLVVILAFIR